MDLFNVQRMSPECKLYQLYFERIKHHRADPPGPGWDGVTVFTTK
jgi:adenylate cyclase